MSASDGCEGRMRGAIRSGIRSEQPVRDLAGSASPAPDCFPH